VELRTAWPGRIVYEDDVQVVAVPFSRPDNARTGVLALPAMAPPVASSPPTEPVGVTARDE